MVIGLVSALEGLDPCLVFRVGETCGGDVRCALRWCTAWIKISQRIYPLLTLCLYSVWLHGVRVARDRVRRWV